jgi:iron(III) transport system substrate-binding protein
MIPSISCILLLFGSLNFAEAAIGWQEEWERVISAGKKEGAVSVVGVAGADVRDALTVPFTKQYGINVEFFGAAGSQTSARILSERQAGKFLWDVYVGGTTTGLLSLAPAGCFDPIEPALIITELKDPKKWRGGGLEFADDARRMLVMMPTVRVSLAVNSQIVDPKSIRSYRDLLQPKWKGKLLIDDPRLAGSSQATFTFFYLHPDLGPEFIRSLAKQDPVLVRDPPQSLSMLGQGKYPLMVGPRDGILIDAMRRGIPIAAVEPNILREGSDVSSGAGNVALFNRAPRPNAAKLYINWLLSKDGQYGYGKALGFVSKRLDVPHDYAESWRVPQPGAIKTYDQAALALKDTLLPFLHEVFGR